MKCNGKTLQIRCSYIKSNSVSILLVVLVLMQAAIIISNRTLGLQLLKETIKEYRLCKRFCRPESDLRNVRSPRAELVVISLYSRNLI